uniref:Uncharacterized protein n=1 Tax=Arundo donax TaxID=35708 RepID=A0A0A9GBQ0_ARUDO
MRGAAGAGVPHGGARRCHRRRLLLRRRRLRLGAGAPQRGRRRGRRCGRPRRLPRTPCTDSVVLFDGCFH